MPSIFQDPSLQFIMDIMMNAWADEVEADGDGLAPLPAPVPAGAGDGPAPLPAPVPGAGADDGAAPDTGVGADDPAGHAPADPAEGEATASFEAHDDAGDVYEPPEFESDDDHDDVCPLNRSLDDYFSEVAQDDDTCMAACDEANTNPAPEADAVPTPVEPVVPVPRPCEESNVGPQAPSLAPDSEAVPNPGELVVPMPTIPEHPSEPLPEDRISQNRVRVQSVCFPDSVLPHVWLIIIICRTQLQLR